MQILFTSAQGKTFGSKRVKVKLPKQKINLPIKLPNATGNVEDFRGLAPSLKHSSDALSEVIKNSKHTLKIMEKIKKKRKN